MKKTTLAFTPWLYGVNVPRGQAQDGVEVAVLGEDLEDLAGLVGEEAVVGQDDRGPAAGLQDRQDVLDEVELLVARSRSVKSSRSGAWFAPLVPKGGLVRITSKRSAAGRLVDRVAQGDVRLDAVQVEVHQRQAARPGDQVLAEVGLRLDALGDVAVERAALGLARSATRRRRRGSRRCRRPGRRW